jgi:hypothetical protein
MLPIMYFELNKLKSNLTGTLMSVVEHSTNMSVSNLEDYQYHLAEAQYHLKEAEKAQQELNWHVHLFQGHLTECKKNIQ